MSDLFGNHIVGFSTRRLIYFLAMLMSGGDCLLIDPVSEIGMIYNFSIKEKKYHSGLLNNSCDKNDLTI